MPDPIISGEVPENLLNNEQPPPNPTADQNTNQQQHLHDNTLPEALGGGGGVEALHSETDSTETTELEKICQTMKTAERDFHRALPHNFLTALNKLNPAIQQHWLQHNMTKAEKYLNEWEEASRLFLNLTEFYDRDLIRCDQQLNSMTAVLLIAKEKFADFTEKKKQSHQASSNQPPTNPNQSPTQPTSASMVKLDLATFSGRNALDFLPWFQAFKASVLDTKFPAVQKMIYLNHYCTGQAKAAIEQFQLTAENLDPAIQVLKDRFNRPDQILNGTFNKLIAIPRLPNNSDTFQLRRFFDTITTSLSIIKNQDNSYDKQPHLLLCAIKAKIPAPILRDFERHRQQTILHSPTQPDNTKSLPFFMNFLKVYVNTEEVIQDRDLIASKKEFGFVKSNVPSFRQNSNNNTNSPRQQSNQYRDRNGVPRPHHIEGQTFASNRQRPQSKQIHKKAIVNSTQSQNSQKCFFCGQKHNSNQCRQASTDPIKAYQKAMDARVCKKCFDHPYQTRCPLAPSVCSRCSNPSHHRLVCVPPNYLQSPSRKQNNYTSTTRPKRQ